MRDAGNATRTRHAVELAGLPRVKGLESEHVGHGKPPCNLILGLDEIPGRLEWNQLFD
jgi:hypothetical protein